METLEIKVSHLERAIQELSDVVYRQQQALDGALEMNRRLREQLETSRTARAIRRRSRSRCITDLRRSCRGDCHRSCSRSCSRS
jgi:uncharacterized coiled-coil protein SlyX